MSRSIMVITSYTPSLLWYRLDMMIAFRDKGYSVYAMGDQKEEEWIGKFEKYGISYHQMYIRRNSINPVDDFRTLLHIVCWYRKIKPIKVFTYQAKPTIYGGIAARMLGIRDIYPMIGGVGSVFLSDGLSAKVIKCIVAYEYRIALKHSAAVFFQNTDDERLFRGYRIIKNQRVVILHGSGVNIEEFIPTPYPDQPVFLFVARLIKDKGIYEYLEASRILKRRYPESRCMIVGPFDSNPTSIKPDELKPYTDEGIVEYYGDQDDVRPYLKRCSIFVLPSYREGTPKAVLEAMACGRAIITTDAVGCRETIIDGENGYLVPIKDIEALADKMIFLYEHRDCVDYMGKMSRRIAVERFDVKIVNKTICETMEL